MSRPLDDHFEFIGPPTRLEVERFGPVTLIDWIPRFVRWHLRRLFRVARDSAGDSPE